jgi:peptidoglycan/LPS O-acetylase OafA/YrhL
VTRQRFYLPQLDGLRFLAFLAVFYLHFMEHTRRPGGRWVQSSMDASALGVDLFFVLSSFLITSLLLREKDQRGTVAVRAFWVRRILRIWPLYFAFVAVVGLFEGLPRWYWLGLLTFTVNWSLLKGWYSSVTSPLWSVSIEEQFYLCWPLVLRALPTRGLPWVCLGMIGLSVTTRAILSGFPADPSSNAIWVNTFARLDPIALGALLAWAWNRRPWASPGWASGPALVSAGIVLTGLQYVWPFFDRRHTGEEAWTYLASAMLLTVVVAVSVGRSNDWLAHPWLVYLGRISYGLYVFHVAAIVVVMTLSLPWLVRLPLTFGFTLLAASLSYRFFELPFLRLTYVSSAPVS